MTDGGYSNIPIAFLKKRGDKKLDNNISVQRTYDSLSCLENLCSMQDNS